MSSKQLGTVIQRAISDGAFRRQLQSDPASALRGFDLTSDEVAAIRFLLDTEATTGAFNLTAPNPLTNKALAHVIGKVLGRPALAPAPTLALRLFMGDMATIVLDGQRALPARLLEAGYQFRFSSAEAALRNLLD
jgi:NAD dependent epimerase/dehydratase family enzyme